MTNLKDSLTQVRDEMVQEDLEKEKTAPDLSPEAEKKILKKKKSPINLRSFFNKKVLAIAASLALVLGAIFAVPQIFRMGSSVDKSAERPSTAPDSKYEVEVAKDPYDDYKEEASEAPPKGSEAPTEGSPEKESGSDNIGSNPSVYPTSPESPTQKIVYRFDYLIQTLDYSKSETSLKKLITSTGSYISNAEVSMNNDLKNASFLVRVPREKSTAFQEGISGIGTVTSQSISSTDMTKSYRDLDAEKTTQDIKEKKLQELLKKAEKFEDILAIQNELSIIESRKVQLTKDMAEIDHDVDYQYFDISLLEVRKTGEPVGKKITFADKIGMQFASSLEDISNFFQGIVLLLVRNWLVIIILAAVGYFLVKKFKNRY